MASNAEMLRLVQHAVAKLEVGRENVSVASAVVAMVYAEAILGMIASCLMPDDAPEETNDAD